MHAVMAHIEVELVDADFLEAISQLEESYISGSQRSTSVSDEYFPHDGRSSDQPQCHFNVEP